MNQTDEQKSMIKNTLILTVITLLAGLMLGFVYELTKEPIRIQQEKAVQEACNAVFPNAIDEGISFVKSDYSVSAERQDEFSQNGVTVGSVFEAKKADGTLAGYVIQTTSSEGYGGNIVLYCGITTEGVLNAVSILEISETPGLGMNAEKVLIPQLVNKKVDQIVYTKTGSTSEEEIDAISGATITTRAVTNAVNAALATASDLRGGK